MCGIAAIIGKEDSISLEKNLRESLAKIPHRGQETFELKVFSNSAIGANRLAIVDRSHGKQPLSNEDESVFAVQNGEIYNYKELKDDLTSRGHQFKTDCDTEVLAHLFEEYREKMVDMLDSEMFAFVVYDKINAEYLAARDPVGVKPLYYAYDSNNSLYLASEIKQLSHFYQIDKIYEFPAGHYLYNGKFVKYFDLSTSNNYSDPAKVKADLKNLVENAVKKRVQTDLPIGVFLSGGVDSSLVMELATKYHHDVTAVILGVPGSSDYETVVKFCEEKGYKYQIVRPNPDYEKEIENLIYYLESYEPLIIRQAFANDVISKVSAKLGLKIVLVGEGADELFAGYNEFSHLSDDKINVGCEMLLKSLAKGHLMRIDKPSMRYMIEIRSPFFDKALVNYALNVDGKLKIKKQDHRLIVKAIWREVASDYLPNYVAYRYKAPFANGAGMNIGFNYLAEDGIMAEIAHKHVSDDDLKNYQEKFPQYKFATKEEIYYFRFYEKFLYNKFQEKPYRLTVKDNLVDLEDQSSGTKLLIAEFDKLALYFPVYLASELGYFERSGLNVDFIATGGDDKTFTSLIQNSAQIGLADPMFSMIENPYAIKGEIIGELVKSPPLHVVTFRSDIKIGSLADLAKYNVGTYEQFSTTNTISKKLLNKSWVSEIEHDKIVNSLKQGDIDVAIVLAEQAFMLENQGATIIYQVNKELANFLFTGFTIATVLADKYKECLPKFLQAVQDSLKYIRENKDESLERFKKMFGDDGLNKTFDFYLSIWSVDLKLNQSDWDYALNAWRTLYPHLLKNINPFFMEKRKEDLIFEELSRGRICRDCPYKEFEMKELIARSVMKNKPISLIGFWGASDKNNADNIDEQAVAFLESVNESIKSIYKPGLHFTAILADKHAEFNGYSSDNFDRYLGQIKDLLEKHVWSCIFLSELWNKHDLSVGQFENEIRKNESGWWDEIGIKDRLIEQATKHSKIDDKILSAQLYYEMRKQDAKVIESEYHGTIFWTYSDSKMQEIFPNIPTIYFYSIKSKMSDSPWFSK